MIRLAALLALLLLAPDAAAQTGSRTARPGSQPIPREIQERTLKNGMNVIVWPDHDIPNVALNAWYRVGSRNERPGITGLSHFFEHMMFNGSQRYPAGEFDRVMEENGGRNNAFTTNDVTVYQDWFPRSALELILQLEADRICCLSFDSTVVESERGVVYSERRTGVDDDNRSFLDEQVIATAFVAHPYQIPVIGWPSDIERWTMPDLKNYFRTYYAPNNATLVVAGDVTPAEVFALAERYLEPIPPQADPPPVLTVEPIQMGERRLIVRKPGQVPLVEVAYHVGSARDEDAYALDLLQTILARGESSRLYRRLVDQDRVAVQVSTYALQGFDPGLVLFLATAPPAGSPDALERALYEELERVGSAGITEEELVKAKNAQLAAYWATLETIDGKAAALGENEVVRGDWRRLFSSPERYARVTRKQIQDLARRAFDPKNRTVGVLIPEG